MGLLGLNPFKKDCQNYPGVVIPLTTASHQNPDSETKKNILSSSLEPDKVLDHASSSENGFVGPIQETSPLTIEMLRAEIEADVATSGHDSVYDRMWPCFAAAAFVSAYALSYPTRNMYVI